MTAPFKRVLGKRGIHEGSVLFILVLTDIKETTERMVAAAVEKERERFINPIKI